MGHRPSLWVLIGCVVWVSIGLLFLGLRRSPDGIAAGVLMVSTGLMLGITEYRGKSV